jgi:hypothetical protein
MWDADGELNYARARAPRRDWPGARGSRARTMCILVYIVVACAHHVFCVF